MVNIEATNRNVIPRMVDVRTEGPLLATISAEVVGLGIRSLCCARIVLVRLRPDFLAVDQAEPVSGSERLMA